MKIKLALFALTLALSPAVFAEAPETISAIPFGTGASGQNAIPVPAFPTYTTATPVRYHAEPVFQKSEPTTRTVRTHVKALKKSSTR